MAILDPLISSANSLQPVVMIVNKLINKIFFIFYFSFGITHPTLLGFCFSFGVGNLNIPISAAVITDSFIRHYISLVYPLWPPCLSSKYFFFSFLYQLSLHNKHCPLIVSFCSLVFSFLV